MLLPFHTKKIIFTAAAKTADSRNNGDFNISRQYNYIQNPTKDYAVISITNPFDKISLAIISQKKKKINIFFQYIFSRNNKKCYNILKYDKKYCFRMQNIRREK